MKQALLVIDVQNEYFTGKLPVTYPQGSLDNIVKAMDRAHISGVPIAVIQHTNTAPDAPTFRKGTPGWELHDEIRQRYYDILVEKTLPGSFTGTDLKKWLDGAGCNDRDNCRLHDPDVLRHDGTPGISLRVCRELPFGCHRYLVGDQYCRDYQRCRSPPGNSRDPADAVLPCPENR